jgi:phytoene dehydrogenase-like protein
VAIIGAGADGLAAAARLAHAGLRVLVIGRGDRCGGRLATNTFHPGYRVSPFQDDAADIPPALLPLLEGVALRATVSVPDAIRARRDGALAAALDDAAVRRPAWKFLRAAPASAPWPGSDLAVSRLTDWPDHDAALAGRALDPELPGSALALLTLPRIESVSGGLGALGDAFTGAALRAGAEIRLGQEVSEIVLGRGRVRGLALADGEFLAADAVLSTLDWKQSLLSLFPWRALPEDVVTRAGAFRMAGATARLLLALNAPPLRARLFLPGDAQARACWRRGCIPENPPLLFDTVSARDPGLAPEGAATATVTLGAIPHHLFDGGWTVAQRTQLASRALARLSGHLPGLVGSLASVRILTPPDMEAALGLTQGDLDGGLLTPDQMLDLRPGPRGGGAAGRQCGRLVVSLLANKHDAIVIGASVAGLAAAAYLLRAGRRVVLLEADAAPQEPAGALVALDPQMVEELKLIPRGLALAQRDLPLVWLGERTLTLGRDPQGDARGLESFSAADAAAWPNFRRALLRQGRSLRPWWWSGLQDGAPHWMLHKDTLAQDFHRLSLTGADAWTSASFQSEALVAALCWDATAGGFCVSEPGSALALVWRASQEMAGLQGAAALAAPGTLFWPLLRAAAGAELRAPVRVTRIVADGRKVAGVELSGGETIAAPLVLSALSRAQTLSLLGAPVAASPIGEAEILLTLNRPHGLDPARYLIAERPGIYLDAHESARAGIMPAELPLEFVPIGTDRIAVTLRPVPMALPDAQALLTAYAVRALARPVNGLRENLAGVKVTLHARQASLAHLLAPAGTRLATPLDGLFLCGDDAEPVAAVSGRAARIAAGFALKD